MLLKLLKYILFLFHSYISQLRYAYSKCYIYTFHINIVFFFFTDILLKFVIFFYKSHKFGIRFKIPKFMPCRNAMAW